MSDYSEDDYDSMDSGVGSMGSSSGGSTGDIGGSDRGDNEKVDRVAYTNPDTGLVNTRNFNTGEKYTKGFDRVNVGGKTIAVSPSAAKSVSRGEGGDTPLTRAISSRQSTSPVQAAQAQSAVSSPIAPTFAPSLINQPLTVGGQLAVMPYDSYQRSPQQMFGYGGLNPSPYKLSNISFQGGLPAQTFDPLGGERISQFDMGRAPTPAGTPDERNILQRAFDAIGGRSYANQRAGVFDPVTGTFKEFDGQTTLEKTSDNVLGDLFGNMVTSALGVSPFVGRLDTKEYTPLAGGERLQYSTSSGGLLSDMIGEKLIPYSELEARQSKIGGDGGDGAPLIIPQEVAEIDEETGEPTAFPEFTPRTYEYQPFTSKFYTIPSRFTQPSGLLA